MPSPLKPAARVRLAASALALLSLAAPWPAVVSAAEPVPSSAEPSEPGAAYVLAQWQEVIQPLLTKNCVSCHGPAKRSGALSMRSIADLLSGGDRGPVIDHEHPEASLLVQVVQPGSDPHMPPDEQLDERAIAAIQDWVARAAAIAPDELQKLASRPEDGVVPGPVAASAYPAGIDPSLVIDMAVQTGWDDGESRIESAPVCDDNTFVRRLYLDLVGRIPTPQQRKEFLNDTDSRKRERLINQLLATPEHARQMAELFDTILMERGDVRTMERRQRHGWIEFLTTAFTENRPWNQVARQILLARPESPSEAGATWYLYERDDEHQQIAEAVSRGIFGVDIQCAQCHDHLLAAEIKQAHYWGLVAFFNRGENVDTPAGPRVAESAVGGFSMFTNVTGESYPNRLVYLHAEAVDEPRPAEGEKQEDRDELYVPGAEGMPRVPRFSRRAQFVDTILADHPLVARAMVNRLWALMMGRGLVHPVDQLDSTHPPSHPDLLDWLAEDFERSGYDVRRLLGQITRSQTYQLSSKSDVFVDPARFAVAALKPLSAETLYRSMLTALEIHDPGQWQTPERLAEFRKAFPNVLGDEDVATVRQALLLTNGSQFHGLLSPEQSGTIAYLCELPDSEGVVREAFVRVLGRSASEEELQRSVAFLQTRGDRPNRGVDQLVWALLTSAEFRFNH